MNIILAVLFVVFSGIAVGYVCEKSVCHAGRMRKSRFIFFSIIGMVIFGGCLGSMSSFDEWMNQKPPEPKVVFLPPENTDMASGIKVEEIKAIAERWLRYHRE